MARINDGLDLRAQRLGKAAQAAYATEFNELPDPETIGDWDSSAWSIHWQELRREGATEEDYDSCLESYRVAFWNQVK